jgi:hypothetical protein
MSLTIREVNDMPRRDGTGPTGAGPMTGKGFGLCTSQNATRYGVGLEMGPGLGFRRGFGGGGFGRGFAAGLASSKTRKELLQDQKSALENSLEMITKELEDL